MDWCILLNTHALTLHIFSESITATWLLCTIRLPHQLQCIPTGTCNEVSGAYGRGAIDLRELVRSWLVRWFRNTLVAWISCGGGYASHDWFVQTALGVRRRVSYSG